jgi:hypothetical protein
MADPFLETVGSKEATAGKKATADAYTEEEMKKKRAAMDPPGPALRIGKRPQRRLVPKRNDEWCHLHHQHGGPEGQYCVSRYVHSDFSAKFAIILLM